MTADELKKYSKQLELMNQVCDEFDSEVASDSEQVKKDRFQRILLSMQQMQAFGSPPPDLVGDVPDFGQPGGFDFSKMPGMPGFSEGSANQQCSLM